MTTTGFTHNAIDFARIATTIPVLVAALLGAIPLVIMCLTCRCCKKACVELRAHVRDRFGPI